MLKYETVIHIINEGDERFDAGERAGATIDGFKITNDMILYCEPTRLHRNTMQQVAVLSSEKYLVKV